MAQQYRVVGGVYADTKIKNFAPGETVRRFGPYDSEDAAREVWPGLSMTTVDDRFFRYRIEEA